VRKLKGGEVGEWELGWGLYVDWEGGIGRRREDRV